MERTRNIDVVVAGAGPAGLAVAAELVERGLRVAVVDPDHAPWPNTYGAFLDELQGLGLSGNVARVWRRPTVWVPERQAVERAYALLDNESLRRSLRNRCGQGGAELVRGRALGVEQAGERMVVRLADGGALHASVVVDATGSGRLMGDRPAPLVAQVALGREVELAHCPWEADEAVWMDFRGARPDESPTFLYALPLGGGRVLLEETSLASSPPMGFDELAMRLDRRMDEMGLQPTAVNREERVLIPLDSPHDSPTSALVAFGASGGLVHPSTGYSVVRSLREAPAFAEALLVGLLEQGGAWAAFRAHRAVWTTRARVGHAMHKSGLGVLLNLDAVRTQRFFHAFFQLPGPLQAAWLDPSADPAQLAHAMARLFGQAGWGVRSDIFLSLSPPRPGGLA